MDPADRHPTARPVTVAVIDHVRGHRDGVALAVGCDPELTLEIAVAELDELDTVTIAGLGGVVLQATGPGIDLEATIARIRVAAPDCTIVVVVAWVDEDVLGWLSTCGAHAVLPTDAPLTEVVAAVHTGPIGTSLHHAEHTRSRARAAALRHHVTGRELEILRRLSEGDPPQRIAHDLERSVATIRDHIRSLRGKLDCSTATELVVTAYRRGMLPNLSSLMPQERRRPR
jgi:DNA-binding NarL/FixJ family response regulator